LKHEFQLTVYNISVITHTTKMVNYHSEDRHINSVNRSEEMIIAYCKTRTKSKVSELLSRS